MVSPPISIPQISAPQVRSIFSFQIPGLGTFTPEQIKNLRDYIQTDIHDILVNKYSRQFVGYTNPTVYNVLVNNYVPNWQNVNTILTSRDALVGPDGIASYWQTNKESIKYLVNNKPTIANLVSIYPDINSIVINKDKIKYLIDNKSTIENLVNKYPDINSIVNNKDALIGSDGIAPYWANTSNRQAIKDLVNNSQWLVGENSVAKFWMDNRNKIMGEIDVPDESRYPKWKTALGLGQNYSTLKKFYTGFRGIKNSLKTAHDNIDSDITGIDAYQNLTDVLNLPCIPSVDYTTVNDLLGNKYFSKLGEILSLYDFAHPDSGSYYPGNPYWSGAQYNNQFLIKQGGTDLVGLGLAFAVGGVVGALLYLLLSQESYTTTTAGFVMYAKNIRGIFEAGQYVSEKIITGDRSIITTRRNNFAIVSYGEINFTPTPTYDGCVFPANLNVSPTGDIGIIRFQIAKINMLYKLKFTIMDWIFYHFKHIIETKGFYKDHMLSDYLNRYHLPHRNLLSQIANNLVTSNSWMVNKIFPAIKDVAINTKNTIGKINTAIPDVYWNTLSGL